MVMINPTGKIPSLVPGRMKLAFAAAVALAAAAADELLALWSAKIPDRNEASLVESSVVRVEPSSALPERAICGERIFRDIVLRSRRQYWSSARGEKSGRTRS